MGELEDHRRRQPRLTVTRPGVVVPVRRDDSGRRGPTKGAARGPRWRRTSRGLYVAAGVDGTRTEQRIVEAAAVLPPYGGVTGWAALRWAGGHWFPGTAASGLPLDVCLATGCADVRPQRGIAVSAESLAPDDLTEVDGVPLTIAVRSVGFEMRHAASVTDAVTIADMAAYDDLVSLAELGRFLSSELPRTGIVQARAALDLATENAWSPMEVRTRIFWQLHAGLPPLWCNVPVFDGSGRHLATPDLLDVEAGVVVEYNGDLHLDAARRRADRDREEMLRRLGLQFVEVVRSDFAQPLVLAARMARARRAGLVTPADQRRWTVEQPRWWVDTSTVEARRALSSYDRARLLAYRRPAA